MLTNPEPEVQWHVFHGKAPADLLYLVFQRITALLCVAEVLLTLLILLHPRFTMGKGSFSSFVVPWLSIRVLKLVMSVVYEIHQVNLVFKRPQKHTKGQFVFTKEQIMGVMLVRELFWDFLALGGTIVQGIVLSGRISTLARWTRPYSRQPLEASQTLTPQCAKQSVPSYPSSLPVAAPIRIATPAFMKEYSATESAGFKVTPATSYYTTRQKTAA